MVIEMEGSAGRVQPLRCSRLRSGYALGGAKWSEAASMQVGGEEQRAVRRELVVAQMDGRGELWALSASGAQQRSPP